MQGDTCAWTFADALKKKKLINVSVERRKMTKDQEDKKLSEKRVMDIIGSAVNTASGGRVENITRLAPDKMMTSEQVQGITLTKEAILEALLQDPRVLSAECREGKFHIATEDGTKTFNFVFGDEGEGTRFVIDDESIKQEPVRTPEVSTEEMVQMLFDLCNEGVTAEDLIKSFLSNPKVISAEYRNGNFHIQSTEGTLNFWFPS
jgi:hypothetical protein